ncbi:hypothetical protein BB559_001393 [Furculomyces boomerangus]|uniref:Uracil-DNA glycosylase n=2 Tax=Harpellales TaxID=61421 RepID=A0A2T9Z2B0_9FUNG|nr:hypothetical protein BB559_004146 [Furculomyces boomerangus]PVU98674.1 hypothetical protein BB559_001393 [Furculomyces boomerangus]PVZ98550.1 hypothetical protein BB558_005455 [Smittium angustum]
MSPTANTSSEITNNKKRPSTLTSFFSTNTVKKNKQETTPETQKSTAIDYEKILETKNLDKNSLEYRTMGHDWLCELADEFSKPYFKQIKTFLEKEKQAKKIIFPPEDQIYSWSKYTAFQNTKVVILGQDPYHNDNQAHGLSFSVCKGITIPPSLKNIYKAIQLDYPEKFKTIPNHGYLKSWADQGVLLLNTTLTVQKNSPNSHSKIGWEQFTDAVINLISKRKTNVVFMLWGSNAIKKATKLIDTKTHLVLKSVHPSPLSAHKGFFECHHFKLANEYLLKNKIKPIEWQNL